MTGLLVRTYELNFYKCVPAVTPDSRYGTAAAGPALCVVAAPSTSEWKGDAATSWPTRCSPATDEQQSIGAAACS